MMLILDSITVRGYTVREACKRAPGYAVQTLHRLGARWYVRRYFESRPDHPATSKRAALEAIRSADSVLILCLGNICRSPMAERYLEARCADADLELTTTGAGLGTVGGRQSPDAAVEAAKRHGVDLTPHRSTLLDREQARHADVVFVMDHVNYYLVSRRFPELRPKTYFLGALDDTDDARIPDPYGHSRSAFEETYDRIAEAIDVAVDAAIDSDVSSPAGDTSRRS